MSGQRFCLEFTFTSSSSFMIFLMRAKGSSWTLKSFCRVKQGKRRLTLPLLASIQHTCGGYSPVSIRNRQSLQGGLETYCNPFRRLPIFSPWYGTWRFLLLAICLYSDTRNLTSNKAQFDSCISTNIWEERKHMIQYFMIAFSMCIKL